MRLLPIKQTLEENPTFQANPDCRDSLQMTINFYKRVGFRPPWISYYAEDGDNLVAACAFKGRPKDGKVEIAYGTFPKYQHRGIGTMICRQLVELAQATDPGVRITARTLCEENFSTRILKKNGFAWTGTAWDEEDGNVWEWEYESGIRA